MNVQLEAKDQPKFCGSSSSHFNSDQSNKKDTTAANVRAVALVTGSSSGIGANVAVDLARAGYRVVLTGRNSDRLNKVVQQCNEVSGFNSGDKSAAERDAVAFFADLLDFEQVDGLIDFIWTSFNRLDVLVNNACWRGNSRNMLSYGDDYELQCNDLERVMHMNVSIPMYLISKCLIPLRSKSSSPISLHPPVGDRRAVVINISSIASQVVVPFHLYSISKACLSEMSKQVALAARSLGILSVTISPGPVLTEDRPHHAEMSNLTLINRVGTTQEISNLIMFAIANAHLFNGKELIADGGYLAKEKR